MKVLRSTKKSFEHQVLRVMLVCLDIRQLCGRFERQRGYVATVRKALHSFLFRDCLSQ
jgi:hypothetical protein